MIRTAECVSPMHPDKMCDRISDTLLDLHLEQDPNSRVAIETCGGMGEVYITGEVTSNAVVTRNDIVKVVHSVTTDDTIEVIININSQSPEIANGVDTGGAGDQGIMFGYACTETKEFMPAPIQFSHKILELLAKERKLGNVPGILPDSKSQVTLIYNDDNKPIGCDNIVVSTQHAPNLSKNKIFDYLYPIIEKSLPTEWVPPEHKIFINPTGKFEIGGPDGDAGLTGRKIIVDTYGGACPHGGGAFSGKDPSKVDRSAAYAARYVAKNIVYAGLAERCTIQLAYAIGMVEPLSVYINTYGTGKINDLELVNIINKIFDLTPRGIREMLNLSNVNYLSTAAYGHFGRESKSDKSFTWEKTDKAKLLLAAIG